VDANGFTGYTLYLEPRSTNLGAGSFARLRIEHDTLAAIGRLQRDSLGADGERSYWCTNVSFDTEPRIPAVIAHTWSIAASATTCRFEAVKDGSVLPTEADVLFRSVDVDVDELLRLLGTPGAAARAPVPPFKVLGSHVLASGPDSVASFTEHVATLVPEVQAELTAAAMSIAVSSGLADIPDGSVEPAPRRLRMGV
jgi:hypothetical protein